MEHLWSVIYDTVAAKDRWPCVLSDRLSCCAMLPLLVMDFRIAVSEIVSVSDASEEGGGVCVSQTLSERGKRFGESVVRKHANLTGND